jgi:hypothetical protein
MNYRDPFQRRLKYNLFAIVQVTETASNYKCGRPPGSVNSAGYQLGNDLYRCCERAGIVPTRVNTPSGPEGILHQLLKLLRGYIGVGQGELDNIFDKVIISRRDM